MQHGANSATAPATAAASTDPPKNTPPVTRTACRSRGGRSDECFRTRARVPGRDNRSEGAESRRCVCNVDHGGLVHADLDTLVVALYVTIDELLEPRRGPGRRPKLSDPALVCLAVAQVLPGGGSERRSLRFPRARLRHLFPYLPTASAHNRRPRR